MTLVASFSQTILQNTTSHHLTDFPQRILRGHLQEVGSETHETGGDGGHVHGAGSAGELRDGRSVDSSSRGGGGAAGNGDDGVTGARGSRDGWVGSGASGVRRRRGSGDNGVAGSSWDGGNGVTGSNGDSGHSQGDGDGGASLCRFC
jgi:hypothetical protein